MLKVPAAVAFVVVLLAACGGDDDDVTPTPIRPTASPTPSPTVTSAAHDVDLCELLTPDDIVLVTGYARGLTVPHNGPGTLHFCTIYLEVAGCRGQCALSIEDLGTISENNFNTPELYRQTLETANPEATMSFTDGVLGEDSWLAVISTADLPAWKLLYFQVGDTAYDLGGPRVRDYSPSNDQMIALAQAVVDKLP